MFLCGTVHKLKNILITAYCQTAGIAAALKELLPDYRIEAYPLPALSNDADEQDFVNKLRMFDVWVTCGHFNVLEKHGLALQNNNFKLIKIPQLSFPAFHPDLCYAEIISTGNWTIPHYNSAIALWCYKHGISIEDAATAFCYQIYSELGYFDIWDLSVAYLRQLFIDHELEDYFNDFFLNVKRYGCFMYSINHPKVNVSISIAKILARKLGVDRLKIEKDVHVIDTLTGVVWPVYPELADFYSIRSNGYVWKWSSGIDALVHGNVTEFLEFTYKSYMNAGVNPSDIRMIPGLGGRIGVDESVYDRVLHAKYGVYK
jgi:hypothetical protein